jgi:hypothetical protein
MRYLLSSLIAFGLIVDLTSGQTIIITPTPPPGVLPEYRPILMGPEANSLVNQIDRQSIAERSQNNQEVKFYCVVNKSGKVISSATYRATPGSDALEQELQKHLDSAVFIPAIHDRKTVDAVYYGTAMFGVVNGRPRLRIFSNQQEDELAAQHDFISPQPYFGGDSKFLGFHYPKKANGKVSGLAELALEVGQDGNLKNMSVVYEYPPDNGFGDAAIADFTGTKFIPAFRDGKPVECAIRLPVFYQAKEPRP